MGKQCQDMYKGCQPPNDHGVLGLLVLTGSCTTPGAASALVLVFKQLAYSGTSVSATAKTFGQGRYPVNKG